MKNILFVLLLFPFTFYSQVSMNVTGTYSQNFNTLLSTGSVNSWLENSTISNWYSQRTSTSTNYAASNGSNTTGGLYSYGSSGIQERALGSIGSGSPTFGGSFAHGVLLKNNGSSVLSNLNLSYTLEEWRNGGSNAAQTITVWYKVSSNRDTLLNPGSNSGWTEVISLAGSSPVSSATSATLDGNNVANKLTINGIVPVNIPASSFIMIRWSDIDHVGSDDGLAIDDVSISWGSCTPTAGTDVKNACDSLLWIDGNTYSASTNSPSYNLTNAAGCDSVVTLDLTLNYSSGGYLYEEVCAFPYTSVNSGQIYTQAGTIIIDSINANGCPHHDTIVVVLNTNMFTTIINLPDPNLPILVSYDPLVLGYQWYNCNSQQIITGENDDTLVSSLNGNYALIASYDYNCIDTSDCLTISSISSASLNESDSLKFKVQPNPSNGIFTINFEQLNIDGVIEIYNLAGKNVYQKTITGVIETIFLPQVSKGIYILNITTSDEDYKQRIIIE
jgi:hypothetical protein